MDKENLKKILIKANSIEKGSIGMAKEFIAIDDKLESIQEKTNKLLDEVDNKLSEVKNEIINEIPEIPELPEYPTEMEISNFPDVQKVEITNLQDKAPIINVEAPQVNVEAPIVNIDTDSIEQELKTSNETLKEISEKLNEKEEIETIKKVTLVDEDGKPTSFGGGGSSAAKYLNNTNSIIINPATEEKQDAIVSAISALGATTNYATQVDKTSTTDVIYIGEATIGSATSSAVWRIQKVDNTGGDTEIIWADGNDNFDNIYDNRTSLTYS